MEQLALGPGMVHPDVEFRMKTLSQKINAMDLRVYKNYPIIKCNQTASIVAADFGTSYSIRTGKMLRAAINAGAKTVHQWSGGDSLNLTDSFGPDWIVGSWHKDEEIWINSLNA